MGRINAFLDKMSYAAMIASAMGVCIGAVTIIIMWLIVWFFPSLMVLSWLDPLTFIGIVIGVVSVVLFIILAGLRYGGSHISI